MRKIPLLRHACLVKAPLQSQFVFEKCSNALRKKALRYLYSVLE